MPNSLRHRLVLAPGGVWDPNKCAKWTGAKTKALVDAKYHS